ncbi:MAG: M12 family metallo-peptidase [Saprospiraceae bacterium]
MRPLVLLFLMLTGSVLSLFSQTAIQLQPSSWQTTVLEDHFDDYHLVEFDPAVLYALWEHTPGNLTFGMTWPLGRDMAFDLPPFDQRSPRFIHQEWDGSRVRRSAPSRNAVYRAGSSIFTVDEQFVFGKWVYQEEEYFLEPLWLKDATAPPSIYILYKGTDARMPANFCSVEDDREHSKHEHATEIIGQEKAGECLIVEIALASDFELYQDFGNNATSVENFMLNTLANVQTNYDDEFADELQYEVVTTFIATCTNTSCDPWTNNTDAGTLLDDFTDWGNGGNFGITFDVATLWSGRNFDGSTIGVAWLGGVCNSLRYNTTENYGGGVQQLRVLWAHELGHNWDAVHDETGTWIMSPSVNASTNWSALSQSDMNAFIASRNCLASCGVAEPPVAEIGAIYDQICVGSVVPFFDETESTVTDRFWDFTEGSPSFSTQAHPLVTFDEPGFYTISLSVENALGDDNTSYSIEVGTDPNFRKILHFQHFENGFGGWSIDNPDNSDTCKLQRSTAILAVRQQP